MCVLVNECELLVLIGVCIFKVEIIVWGMVGFIVGFIGLMFGDFIWLEFSIIIFMVILFIVVVICGWLDSLGMVLVGGLFIGVLEFLLMLLFVFKFVCIVVLFMVVIVMLFLL